MAITASATGGNWSSTTAWVGGVVPSATDDVNLTASSGNITIDGTSASPSQCRSFNCAGYAHILTHAAGKYLVVGDPAGSAAGGFGLVTGMTYTPAATSVLQFVSGYTAGNQNISAAGKTLGSVTFLGNTGSEVYVFQATTLPGTAIGGVLTVTSGKITSINVYQVIITGQTIVNGGTIAQNFDWGYSGGLVISAGTFTQGGVTTTINVGLTLSGGTLTQGNVLTCTGPVNFSGGAWNNTASWALNAGTQAINVSGGVTWQPYAVTCGNFTITGAGTNVTPQNTSQTIANLSVTDGQYNQSHGNITLTGTVTCGGSGYIYSSANLALVGTITTSSAGYIQVTGNITGITTITNNGTGAGGISATNITASGAYTGGGGWLYCTNYSGTSMSATAGGYSFEGGGTWTLTSAFSSTGTSGSNVQIGSEVLTGATTVIFSGSGGGQIPTFNCSGNITISGGTWTGYGTITTSAGGMGLTTTGVFYCGGNISLAGPFNMTGSSQINMGSYNITGITAASLGSSASNYFPSFTSNSATITNGTVKIDNLSINSGNFFVSTGSCTITTSGHVVGAVEVGATATLNYGPLGTLGGIWSAGTLTIAGSTPPPSASSYTFGS